MAESPISSTLGRLAATAFLAVAFAVFAACMVSAQSAPEQAPPAPVIEAIEGVPAPQTPNEILVGAYINDIQQLDFKTNNYAIDLYVWFRWKAPDIDPSKTMEFMNRYTSGDNLREALMDEPEAMPDGSRYAIIRYQGRFSTKFRLDNYPFDRQRLTVVMEDTLSGAATQVYVPDGDIPWSSIRWSRCPVSGSASRL